ncbi:amidase domain-containing protein [Longirhabdus pacifica]|uniref:amidase domain-containing protein n=1 Tax=Longirhabdus pacifica TaxID=2305227 RepID=UPI001F0CB89B|nr:amidase domain-containing protein [Longirhabdus pacifica]
MERNVYPLIKQYVQLKSDMRIGNFKDVDWIKDQLFKYRAMQKTSRIRKVYQIRKVTPIHCQMHAVVTKVKEVKEETTIYLVTNWNLVYTQGNTMFADAGSETETMVLKKEHAATVMKSVVVDDIERCPFIYQATQQHDVLYLHIPANEHTMKQGQEELVQEGSMDHSQLPSRKVAYDRQKAANYADQWWNKGNEQYIHFDVDCTNYVSQCLYAGGAPIYYTGKRASGWWYKQYGKGASWSFSWTVSHSLYLYLTNNKQGLQGEVVSAPEMLDIGDVIFYDWNGNGRFEHSVIVTDKDAQHMPLVNAHTLDSKHRYWNYHDSHAWTERTTYAFVHIADYF